MSLVEEAPWLKRLLPAVERELPAAEELRHRIHAAPCVSGAEGPTRDLVLGALPGDAHVETVAQTGAVVRIGGAGRAVGIRAELDALPLVEASHVPWASQNGAMHACGHDVHLAAALAVARAVATVGGPSSLLLILQPREESVPSGAGEVLASGVLQRNGLAGAIAAHVQPMLPRGAVACDGGPVNAAADDFVVTMRGRAGHAGYPHLNRDPVLALAHFIVSVQQLVAREVDPMSPAVVTVGQVSGGTMTNATPDAVAAHGTLRAMSQGTRDHLRHRLRVVADGIAAACGVKAEVTVATGDPILHNDPWMASRIARLLPRLGLAVADELRSCGADDFSHYAAEVPGVMMFVGTGDPDSQLHSPGFVPDDGVVGDTARALLAGYLAASQPLSRTSVDGRVSLSPTGTRDSEAVDGAHVDQRLVPTTIDRARPHKGAAPEQDDDPGG